MLVAQVTASANDIGVFVLFFALVVLTYAIAMHTSFGTDVPSHRSLLTSIFQHCFFVRSVP
jgi:hypothetical protein